MLYNVSLSLLTRSVLTRNVATIAITALGPATGSCKKPRRKALTGALGLITTLGARGPICLVGVLGPTAPVGGPIMPTLCCEGKNGCPAPRELGGACCVE